jgi:hypothetical protein
MSFGLWSCQAASKSSFFFCLRSPAVLSGSSHRECCPAKAFSYFGLRTSRCTGLHGYFLTGILFFSRARNPPTGLRAQERAPVLLSLCPARFWVPPGRSPSVPWSAARSYQFVSCLSNAWPREPVAVLRVIFSFGFRSQSRAGCCVGLFCGLVCCWF